MRFQLKSTALQGVFLSVRLERSQLLLVRCAQPYRFQFKAFCKILSFTTSTRMTLTHMLPLPREDSRKATLLRRSYTRADKAVYR